MVRSVRRGRRSFAGFTLLELMVVVVIIGISAALAAPALTRAMAISRADRANHNVVRLMRFARSQSMAYGRAYLVRMQTGGNGRVELWEGTTSACRLENWTVIMATGNCSFAGGAASGNCVDFVDSAAYDGGFHAVRFDSVGAVDICFQPNGDALTRPTGATGAFGLPPAGASSVTTTRLEGGASVDTLRGAVIPIDSAPRSGTLQ